MKRHRPCYPNDFLWKINTDPFNIYRVLRSINPSPYLYYLDLGDEYTIVGSSPERLVQLEDGKVETNPIAGTRPRGQTEAEDKALAAELLADAKEIREHQMLVHLGKQDISSDCKTGYSKGKQRNGNSAIFPCDAYGFHSRR